MRRAVADAWGRMRAFRAALMVVVLLLAVFSIMEPGFRTVLNLQNVLSSVAILWIVAMAQTFVLISGGFDLSVGACVSFCSIFLAKVLEASVMPGPIAVVLTIVVGALLGGLFNGFFIAVLRLNVFVVTLASMTIISGLVLIWTNMNSIYVTAPIITQLGVAQHFGIQAPLYIMVVVLVVFAYVQKRTYYGRDVYATGGSFTAARLSGIRTTRTLVTVYAVAGACAGLASVVAIGRLGAATPEVDHTLALNAVAAVLIGGTALTGGAGSVVGTVFGVLFIGILQNGLNMVGVASPWQYVVTGIVLLTAVLGGHLGHGRSRGLPELWKSLRIGSAGAIASHTTVTPSQEPAAGDGNET